MNIEELKNYIKKHVSLEKIYLKGNKDHIHIFAIGKIFIGLSEMEKQKIIYKPLAKYILEKKIHAVTIDTFTPNEWVKKNNI